MPMYSDELQEQLARIDRLQQQIDALRPLPSDVQARIFQKFRLDWNYHSNSIEGNSLTYGETVAFIMEGVTAKGKPLKDHLDLRGHNQAIDVLQDMIRNPDAELTERDIRELHSIIMAEPYKVTVETSAGPQRRLIEPGQYKTMPNHTLTGTGETHYYATPEETPGKMHDLIEWYRTHRSTLHPLVLAAQFHHKFVAIHPFDDGNGRMTRLLTNMLLMKAGYPPIVVKTEEKREYYAVLSQADAGIETPLLEYFAERLIRSLEIYLKGARGEDISDMSDLDKEITLLKISLTQEDGIKEVASINSIISISNQSLTPLFFRINNKIKQLKELFLSNNVTIKVKSKKLEIVNKDFNFGTVVFDGHLENYTNEIEVSNDLNETLQKTKIDDAIIFFTWHLKGFNKSQTPFDLTESISIEFDEYWYIINRNNIDSQTKKLYHHQLIDTEINKIISEITRRFITAVNRQLGRSVV